MCVIIWSTMLCWNTLCPCFCNKTVKQFCILWHLMMQYTWNYTKGETGFLIKRKTAWSMHCKMAMLLVLMASLNMGAIDAYHGGTCKSFWYIKMFNCRFWSFNLRMIKIRKGIIIIFFISSFNLGENSCSSLRQSSLRTWNYEEVYIAICHWWHKQGPKKRGYGIHRKISRLRR